VTRGAQTIATEVEPVSLIQSPVWGLARVIAHEHLDLRCAAIDLDPAKPEYERDALFQELWSEDSENQLAMRGDTRYAARLVRYSTERAADHGLPGSTGSLPLPVLNQPFRLAIRTPGVLDTLTLQTTTPAAPGPGEVGIEVRASGLNFNDVMKAMHIYPGLPNGLLSLGCECAGKIISIGEGVEEFQLGDEVVAVTNHALGSHVVADARLVFHKLDRHSFEEAATISIVFLTAFHALHSLARLGKGERVLIHSAAGGVGLAAVQLAQRVGAEIFATAGNPERREFLRSLGIRYVFDSRSLAFADEVMEHTSGEGVDVVLNSLTGEAIPKGLSILRPYGRFLEIGKRDIYRNRQIGLNPFRNNLSYFAIDLDRMSRERPAYVGSQLREVMQQFTDGKFHPLPVRVFPVSEVIDAFRYMAQAKQIGKIAISLPQQNSEVTHAGVGRAEIRSDCTYLISGGIGGLGLEVAKWLVEHGARHLVLMGRRGVSATVQKALDAMKRTDGEVVVLQADVSQRQQIAAVLDRIRNSMPPLKGIIHAAGVLDDGILLQLNRERFAKVMAPKTEGAWNLHVLTRDLSLDFFVLFSSAVSLLGSPGQGNHTAANAFLDALAHYRRAQGRPCLSINWGPWSEIGAAAESNRAGRLMLGISSIRPEQGIEALEHLLRQDAAQAGVMVFEAQKWYQAHPTAIESPSLLHLAREQSNTDVSKPQKNNIRETLVVAQVGHRRSLLESHLREQISRVLKLPPSRIDPQKPLASMGLDSLMVLEVSNLLESSLKVPLSATVIWNYPTVAVLADHLAKKMGVPLESPVKSPAQEKSTNQFSELEGQQIANVLAALKNLSGEDLR
jgi:NADPH:quinone reductase-like Zn-dependent oxidoreductase/acyl carrier protein